MLDLINKILWAVATSIIIISSCYFTCKLKLIQFNFKEIFKNLFNKNVTKDSIKPIQSLLMVLGGRIGVGSIAGVALAIYLGGIGSIFWMWIIALLSATNTFAETVLGSLYKVKDEGNIYRGGPSYYIKNGLKKPFLGIIYAILIIVSYIGGFLSIQTNTITKSLNQIIKIDPVIVGILIVILTAIIIYGGVKKIIESTTKIVPLMTYIYISVALYVIITNFNMIPAIFLNIMKDAFQYDSFFGGFLGTMIIGIQRGIFSNEAGLGTDSIASSTTADRNPVGQGFIQMIGIYITTMIICTSTAIIILTSDYNNISLIDANGIEITQYAFKYHLGSIGGFLLFVSIFLFSYSTILTGYYYGESCLKFFFNKVKPLYLHLLKIVTLIVLFFGCIITSTFLWKMADIMVALLAIINIYSLLSLRRQVIDQFNYYNTKKYGKM